MDCSAQGPGADDQNGILPGVGDTDVAVGSGFVCGIDAATSVV